MNFINSERQGCFEIKANMLPRLLYELLPYLYLSIGFFSGLVFDSDVIFVAATLLISSGIAILFMRYHYRKNNVQAMLAASTMNNGMNYQFAANENFDSQNTPRSVTEHVNRAMNDRRQHPINQFPLMDNFGKIVMHERRMGDRRLAAA